MLRAGSAAVLPKASCTVTRTRGSMGSPATTLEGWPVNARRDAMPGRTANRALEAAGRLGAEARSVYVSARSMCRFEKDATPLASGTDIVPDSVPPTRLIPRNTATDPVARVTTLPPASVTATLTAGASAAPATTAPG